MLRRSASLYKLPDRVIICANARGPAGAPFDHEPFVQLCDPIPADALGRALKEAIAQFRDNANAGETSAGAEFLSYFAQLSGVSSYREFMGEARYCSVEEVEGTISFHPMENDQGAFESLQDDASEIAVDTSDETLGRAAEVALTHAR